MCLGGSHLGSNWESQVFFRVSGEAGIQFLGLRGMGRGHLTKSQSSIPKAEERHRISKTYFCHFVSFLKIFRSVNAKPNCSGDFSPLWSFEASFPILKLFQMCKEALSTWVHTLSFLQTEYNPAAPSVAQATLKSLQFFCFNLLSAMLGLQVWMTMPGPCLVMVFREGTGHWTETLFFFPMATSLGN